MFYTMPKEITDVNAVYIKRLKISSTFKARSSIRFQRGDITSDVGGFLLLEVSKYKGIISVFSHNFTDFRKAENI